MRKNKLSGFWSCAVYAAVLGVMSFAAGRIVPKKWFHSDRFPFRCSEKEKKLYAALRVKDWQSKVPDMSRLFKRIMPAKRINADTLRPPAYAAGDLRRRGDAQHPLRARLGLPVAVEGIGGVLFAAVYILLGNVPFVIIQRYNRPRLQKAHGAPPPS